LCCCAARGRLFRLLFRLRLLLRVGGLPLRQRLQVTPKNKKKETTKKC